MDYIQPIIKELDEAMHELCRTFILIGRPIETPRYFNFGNFRNGVLRIQSTQRSNLFFDVLVDNSYPYIDGTLFWKQFKKYRTEFLLSHYPTISPY